MIGYVDVTAQNGELADELVAALRGVIAHGQLVLGPEVGRFEAHVAELHELPWALGVNSGTDALALALQAAGVGPGDEVVTVPNSFVATAAAVNRVGATPVFVDVDDHQLLDIDQLDAAIGPRTRAVIPVHLNGRPVDMTRLLAVADSHNLIVIEDCAQAFGARWDGQPVGSFGRFGCYSLHPLKNLAALGDGGVIVGRAQEDRHTLSQFRNHGLADRNSSVTWGANTRLDTIHSAFLLVKLTALPRWTARRLSIVDRYLQDLADLPIVLPRPRERETAVWSGFVIRVPERDAFQAHLAANGVQSLVYYPVPLHLQPAAKHLGYRPGDFPNAERQAAEILSLPVHPHLTDEEVATVIEAVKGACAAEMPR